MGIRLSGKKFTIYTTNHTAQELIVMSHGGMTEGDGTAKPPGGASVRFYTAHWTTGSGGNMACALAGLSKGSYKAVAKSVSGPGSPVWNYVLTWKGPGGMRPHERELIDGYAKGQGSAACDLAVPDEEHDISLKDLFKAIDKAKIHYTVIHYCPCRVVNDKEGHDIYDPELQRKMDSGEVKFG